LNRERAIAKQSLAIRQGNFASVGMLMGAFPPKEWYEAATDTPDQALFLYETEKAMFSARKGMS
jgi:hypothetical protein